MLAAATAVARREGLPRPGPGDDPRAATSRSRTSPSGRSASSRTSGSPTGCGSSSPTSSTRVGPYAGARCAATGCCGRSTPTSTRRCSSCAAGGTLLTGVGGDELWAVVARRPHGPRAGATCSRWRRSRCAARVLARRRADRLPVAARAGRRPRGALARPRESAPCRWTRAGRMALVAGHALHRRSGPRRSTALAADAGAAIAHPLLDLGCGRAVAAARRVRASAAATTRCAAVAGHAAARRRSSPRRTKASFDARVLLTSTHARSSASWDGRGRARRSSSMPTRCGSTGAATRRSALASRCCRRRGWRQPAIASSSRSVASGSESQPRGRRQPQVREGAEAHERGGLARRQAHAAVGQQRAQPLGAAHRLDRDLVAPLERDPAAQRQLGGRPAPSAQRASARVRRPARSARRRRGARRPPRAGRSSAGRRAPSRRRRSARRR